MILLGAFVVVSFCMFFIVGLTLVASLARDVSSAVQSLDRMGLVLRSMSEALFLCAGAIGVQDQADDDQADDDQDSTIGLTPILGEYRRYPLIGDIVWYHHDRPRLGMQCFPALIVGVDDPESFEPCLTLAVAVHPEVADAHLSSGVISSVSYGYENGCWSYTESNGRPTPV